MPRTLLILALLTSHLLAAALPAQETIFAKPREWAPRDMLSSLGSAVREARQPAVEAALRDCPASLETLLLALITPRYLDALWADPTRSYGPVDPAGANVLPGRVASIERTSGAALPGATVTLKNETYAATGSHFVSPLLLDLNFDGLPGVAGGDWAPHEGTDFTGMLVADVNYDGYPEIVEWVDGTDGLLVDPSDPSKVSVGAAGPVWTGSWSGADLVGTAEGYRDGFEKLSLRDADHDGRIAEAELAGLYVWRDADLDAEIDAGELRGLAAQGVTQLRLPAPGEATGTFTAAGQTGMLWDWWPSYSIAKKIPTGPVVGPPITTAQFNPKELTLDKRAAAALSPDANGWISRPSLEEAGFEWETLLLAALAPDGSRLILIDRGVTAEQVQEGKAMVIWSVMAQDNAREAGQLTATAYLLPLPSIRQAVFRSRDRILFVGGNDGLLLLDLAMDRSVLLHNPAGGSTGAGFRPDAIALRHGDDVYVTGYFHDAKQVGQADSLARFELESLPEGASGLVQAATLDAMYGSARVHGEIRMSVIASPQLAFCIVRRPETGASALFACRDGGAMLIDEPVSLGGIAASGNSVLYFRPTGPAVPGGAGLAAETEAVVRDIGADSGRVIARGELSYPYLAADGSVSVVTDIRWSDNSDSGALIFLAPNGKDELAMPFLETRGIGALRVSEDGSTFAFLGPDGLKMGRIPRGEGPSFLRGNANGSAIPPLASEANDISDAIYLLGSLFLGGPAPPCMDAADANDDGLVDISDAIKILGHLFTGGAADAALPAPWPEPGEDPTVDEVGCDTPQG